MFDFAKGPLEFIRGGKYPFSHSVLIADRVRAVIDASSDQKKLQAFKDQGRVDYLITSHAHEDHLIFNYLFRDSEFGAHPADAPHFASIDSLIDCYGDMSQEDFAKWRHFLENDCHYWPRKAEISLLDGMIVDFGSTKMEVIHTPGHTKGHLAFYFLPQKIMFTADLDLTKFGAYYADRGSDIAETISSLKRLQNYEVETYLTSHGKGIFDGDPQHIERYLQIIFAREERLIELLQSGPKTLGQIVAAGIIYGKKSIATGPWDLSLSEKMMMLKHLERLTHQDRVKQEGELFFLLR